MVLNPYSSYEEMITICRMVLEKDPRVVCQRDGFKLTPLEPHLLWLLMCTLQKPFTRQQPDAIVGQSRWQVGSKTVLHSGETVAR